MPDRTGLLYFLSRLFFRHRFNIIFAGISTEAGVAGDTFYLEPFYGEPDKTPEQLAALRSAIEAML
jgi:UTP:GlnB (protein PII) uridylyltransferase